MNRPRPSILSLFDPLNRPASPDSDKENSSFFHPTSTSPSSQPYIPKRRLVDIGDLTLDNEPSIQDMLDEEKQFFEDEIQHGAWLAQEDENDTLTFRDMVLAATPKTLGRHAAAPSTSVWKSPSMREPRATESPRTPLAEIFNDKTPMPTRKAATFSRVPSALGTPVKASKRSSFDSPSTNTNISTIPSINVSSTFSYPPQPPTPSQEPNTLASSVSTLDLELPSSSDTSLIANTSAPSASATSSPDSIHAHATPASHPSAHLPSAPSATSHPTPPTHLRPNAHLLYTNRQRHQGGPSCPPSSQSSLTLPSHDDQDNRHSTLDLHLHTSFQLHLASSDGSFDLLNDRISFFGGDRSGELDGEMEVGNFFEEVGFRGDEEAREGGERELTEVDEVPVVQCQVDKSTQDASEDADLDVKSDLGTDLNTNANTNIDANTDTNVLYDSNANADTNTTTPLDATQAQDQADTEAENEITTTHPNETTSTPAPAPAPAQKKHTKSRLSFGRGLSGLGALGGLLTPKPTTTTVPAKAGAGPAHAPLRPVQALKIVKRKGKGTRDVDVAVAVDVERTTTQGGVLGRRKSLGLGLGSGSGLGGVSSTSTSATAGRARASVDKSSSRSGTGTAKAMGMGRRAVPVPGVAGVPALPSAPACGDGPRRVLVAADAGAGGSGSSSTKTSLSAAATVSRVGGRASVLGGGSNASSTAGSGPGPSVGVGAGAKPRPGTLKSKYATVGRGAGTGGGSGSGAGGGSAIPKPVSRIGLGGLSRIPSVRR